VGAAGDNKSLVYKRRILLPQLTGKDAEAARQKAHGDIETIQVGGSGGGVYDVTMPLDLADVDAEAEQAASAQAGAHRLAYVEAVYNVTQGTYLLPLQDAIILAGLQLITDKGRLNEGEIAAVVADAKAADGFDWYRSRLASFLSAQAVAEHKATSGADSDALLVRGWNRCVAHGAGLGCVCFACGAHVLDPALPPLRWRGHSLICPPPMVITATRHCSVLCGGSTHDCPRRSMHLLRSACT
jgi:hypothetical protein